MMRNINKNKHLYLIIVVLLSFIGCVDMFDTDISDEEMLLLAPADNIQTQLSTHTFWWTEIEFSKQYNLQIVKPNFSATVRLILDTIVTDNKFTFQLLPGDYEWRVQAQNASSQTDYAKHSITVNPGLDISEEIIQLISPSVNDTTNELNMVFNWLKLYNAENYNFELTYDHFTVFNDTTENDSIHLQLTWGEGDYEWKVKGVNSITETPYYSNSFYIDVTSPDAPELLFPLNEAIKKDSVISFEWSRIESQGSSLSDSIIILNQDQESIKLRKLVNSTFYRDSLGVGVYYWYVKSIDRAGNVSIGSASRKLIIQ